MAESRKKFTNGAVIVIVQTTHDRHGALSIHLFNCMFVKRAGVLAMTARSTGPSGGIDEACVGVDNGAMRTASWDTWDEMQAWPRKHHCGVKTDKQPDQLVFPGIHYAKALDWPKINRRNDERIQLYLQVKLFAKRIQYKPALSTDLSIFRIYGICFGEKAAMAAVASDTFIRTAKRVSGRTQ